ncbi:MAG: glycosyltransferase family 4 protein [Acidimicrobiales bacterium]
MINIEQLLQRAPGGIGRYTVEILRGLPQHFPDDVVIPFTARHTRSELERAYATFGLDPSDIPTPVVLGLPRPILYDAWNFMGHPRLARLAPLLGACDLVHAPSSAVPPTGRTPLVVSIHDAAFALFPSTYPARGRRFHRLGAEAAAQRADLVITGSTTAKREIAENTPIPATRIRVVPYGVDHTKASTAAVDRALRQHRLVEIPYVLWVGSLEPRKNVGTLLEAFARLIHTSQLPHHLVFAGPSGWLEKGLIDDGLRNRLADRFHALGRVADEELRALYAGADLFAFPSLHEGFGLPLLEAMVQNTPVVCSDISALREVAGDAAHFVTPTDVEAWVNALGQLLSEPAERTRLVSAGRMRSQSFSWERTVRGTRAVYQEVVGPS